MEINLENREKIITLLNKGICPVCGRYGLKVPLIHIARIHGFDRNEFKDLITLGHRNGFMDPNCKERRVSYCKNKNTVARMIKRGKGTKATNSKAISYANKKHYKNGRIRLSKGNPNKQSIINAQVKQVVRISQNGEITEYASIKEAAKANGVTLTAVSNCLRGKTRSSAGYKWKYQ
jgi:LAS superfamily LD-carboxypeptidase LdcB